MAKAKRLKNLGEASSFISTRVPFSVASMSGVEGSTATGRMSDDEIREYRKSNPTYTVRSYGTPIAWHGDAGWQQSSTKYSSTTSKHQGIVRRALNEHFQSGHDGAKNPDYGIPLGEK
jgi:hypothetical protein